LGAPAGSSFNKASHQRFIILLCSLDSTKFQQLTLSKLAPYWYADEMNSRADHDLKRYLRAPVATRQKAVLESVEVDNLDPPPQGFFRVRYIGYQSASRFATLTGGLCGDVPIDPA
jgi:hypothetical protein